MVSPLTEQLHYLPHFDVHGLCQCNCSQCKTSLAELCLCLDCLCELEDEHGQPVD